MVLLMKLILLHIKFSQLSNGYKKLILILFLVFPVLSHAQNNQTFDVYSKNRFNESVNSLVTLAENSNRAAPFTTLRTDINTIFNSVPAVLKTIDSINALQNQKSEAFAAFLPKVSVSAGSGTKDQRLTTYASDGGSTSKSISASQLIYDFGTSTSTYASAEAKLSATEYSAYAQRSEILLQMISATLDYQKSKQSLVFTQGFIDTRKDFLEIMRQKEDLGAGSKLDIIRARTKLSEALDELPVAEKKLIASQATYKNLFGFTPKLKEISYQTPLNLIVELNKKPDDIIVDINAFKEADNIARSLKEDYFASRGRLFGAITAEASRTLSRDYPLNQNAINTAMVVYRADIFAGFAQSSRAKALASKASEAEFERDRVRRDLIKRLEVAQADVNSTQDAFRTRLDLLKGSQATDIATRELFLLNRGSLTDVFKAQEDVFSAAQKLIAADFDRKIAIYTFLHLSDRLIELFDLKI
jgi:adhesin transport system outer membrane protein